MSRSAALALVDRQSGPERLPALIDRARQTLAQARSSAEVLEAKAIAEAALHLAKLTKAANETHADCLRIICRAEMRVADEVDAGQARGEIGKVGRPKNDPESGSFSELGLDPRRVDEWREIRDAGQGVIEQAIGKALADGRAPTKADILRAVAGDPHVSNNSGENEWYTPAEYIEAARSVLVEIDLDPASSRAANKVVKAKRIFTIADDGLSKTWRGRVWMNPPYAQPLVSQFADKLAASVKERSVTTAVVLVNNATETAWFRTISAISSAVCFPTGRVRFWSPGKDSAAPLQGQALLYVGTRLPQFRQAFSPLGEVWTR